MSFAFFGTPRFAAIVLKRLIAGGLKPNLLVCNPDRPFGRKKIIMPPPAKEIALQFSIPVFQPESLKEESVRSFLSQQTWDAFVVSAYAKLIPKKILSIPRLGTLNIHPSLLPRHRGPSPIQTAILDGDEEIGVTIFLIDEKIDHGPILKEKRLMINDKGWTYLQLETELAELGADLLIETLPLFLQGGITPHEQDHSRATYTQKLTADDAYVPWDDLAASRAGDPQKALRIERMIRALNHEPGVWTTAEDESLPDVPRGRRVKLLSAHIRNGALALHTVHVEGKQPRTLN